MKRVMISFLVVALLAACGGPDRRAAGSSASPTGSGSLGAPLTPPRTGTGSPTTSPTPRASRPTAGRPTSTVSPTPDYTNPTSSPAPFQADWEDEMALEATITPSCIKRGGLATITIETVPEAALAYHAIYAGSRGGAPPPYGSGYGGNNKGFADRNGRYRDTWIVAVNAPPGPGRADVVATDGAIWGYDDPPFWVADPDTGAC